MRCLLSLVLDEDDARGGTLVVSLVSPDWVRMALGLFLGDIFVFDAEEVPGYSFIDIDDGLESALGLLLQLDTRSTIFVVL